MALVLGHWLDRASAKPYERTRALLVLELEASASLPSASPRSTEESAARLPATTVLALDVSGSMQGEPIDHVIRSVDRLVDVLGEDDEVAIVAFSDGATCVVPPTRVDAPGRRLVRSRVARLYAEGQTNLEAGIELAMELLAPAIAQGALRRRGIVVLSDGQPNAGANTAEALRAVVRRHRSTVSIASLGYGVSHDEDILSAIGDAGGGGYELVPDPSTCARAFARALGAQADVVAGAIELTIAPAEGVTIAALVGAEPGRFARGGLTISLPDMTPATKRLVVVELDIEAPGNKLLTSIAEVHASWRTPGSDAFATTHAAVALEVADREPLAVVEALRRVMLVRADRARDDARAHADRGQWDGAATLVRRLLRDIEQVPGFVIGEASPLGEAYELLVDEAMAFERRPSAEAYAQFRKGAVASKLAVQAPVDPASLRGPLSSRLLDDAAGDFPEAYAIVKEAGHERRVRLGAECVIGRTKDADIRVAHESVSRCHAEIFAQGGEFWARDYGSTNVTTVNGAVLGSAPHKLVAGDVLAVGAIEIVFESPPR